MKKNDIKPSVAEKEAKNERIRDVIRKTCDFEDGAEVILGSCAGAGKPEIISHFFSSKIPKLEIKSKAGKRIIDVELSSAEEDNHSLLHYLFSKSK